MKKLIIFLIVAATAMSITACRNTDVTEVAVTAPWDKMNLPVKENARVYSCNAEKLMAFHKGAVYEVAGLYIDAFEKDRWKMTNQKREEYGYIYNFEKNGDKVRVDVSEYASGYYIFADTTRTMIAKVKL